VNNFCYIHIPFCSSKCSYCRFASFWNLDELKINIYIKYLLKEIQKTETGFNELKSVYFWWWTPAILKIEQLEKILNKLREKYWFDRSIEINIEATPITITKSNLIWWKNLWINRVSIWIQTLNNKSLIEIWRWNKWDIIKALDNIKEVWFDNVSIDFIIWLPYIKKWEIKKDMEYILNNYNFIKHISVYMLEEYYYPWKWKNISISFDEYLVEYINIKEYLKIRWFNRYEISNFAISWYECKHNKSYWDHSSILAFWLWSHWFKNWVRYNNSEQFNKYYLWEQIIDDKLKKSDYFMEKIMFWLRTTWLTNNLYKKLNIEKIDKFIIDWFLIKKSDKIILSDKGIVVMDYILKEII
jgi:oxygen-independent coproporphyrinogen III oxidase